MELTGPCNSDSEFISRMANYVQQFESHCPIVIWGVGKSCKILIDAIKKTHTISFLVDSNEALWGTTYKGYEIKSPQSLSQRMGKIKVMIMPFGFERYDIADVLMSYGFKDDEFCFGNEYLVAFNYVKNDKVVLQNLGFLITGVCNLRCRDCIAHIPYYRKGTLKYIPLESVKHDIDTTFSVVDFVNLITLSTGEMFLHPHIDLIFEYLTTYRKRYNIIQTPTNGTILPKQNTLETMHNCGIGVYISDYSNTIGSKSRIPELISLLEQYDVTYETFQTLQGGKSDIPIWSEVGPIGYVRDRSNDETFRIYQSCANRQCQISYGGKMYSCGSAVWAEYGGLYQSDAQSDFSEIRSGKVGVLRAWFGATLKGYPEICSRCNGIGPRVNNKVIPAGVQVEKRERRQPRC